MTATASSSVPAVGELAPDFTLPSTSGDKVTLSALRGKPVLIAFFPLAFSSTCTAELCEMRDDHGQFAERSATVLPISVDHTYSLKEYKAKYNMHVDLLSDFKRDVSRLYGVLLEEKGIAENRLITHGYGKTDFVATNDTDEGRAQNRRVELVPID